MKFFRRFKPDGRQFFVDENGNEVSEALARQNLQEAATTDRLNEACRCLTGSDAEANVMAEGLRRAARGQR